MIEKLYSIGEIAAKTGVTTRTLRYYEEIGLIEPDLIKENGYRYYSERTATIIPVIKYLQFMDFNLKEIKDFIDNGDYEKKMISFKTAIARTKEEINKLKARIAVISDWDKLINESVIFHLINKEVPIKVRRHEKVDVIKYDMDFDFDYKKLILSVDFANFVSENNTTITDSVMAYYPSFKKRIEDEKNKNTTPVVCLQKTVSKIENIENMTRIEEGYYLSTYHLGAYNNIIDSYIRAENYAKEKGYTLKNEAIERFVLDYWTTTNEGEFVTEILIPIENYEKFREEQE
ncbi:MerR family transcriptional regulator [Peptoniphilus sp. AGMB00490]|uniref:MerR family transcriptional regulator n=1 Tax=Peptoniphilus faecalis TaxID=2731255 RepID=A0A848RLZ4_9FIRM|nr:MerR family transcriptional regulator [Peptoniphilus faecalis]NMW85312.1 MerR family transcriptional regulator [Peptoniphilus faecalis]